MRNILLALALAIATTPQSLPQARIDAVVNSASFEDGLPAGGSLATAFCSGLPLAPGAAGYLTPGVYVGSSPLPYELGGVRVFVNGVLAPILAVVVTSTGDSMKAQVNFQVPLERNVSLSDPPSGLPGRLAIGPIAEIQPLPRTPRWGGFFADADGYAIAQHAADYSRVTADNPARPGETIIAYANDFFSVWPHPPVGFPTPLQPLFQILPPSFVRRAPGYLYLQEYPLRIGGQSITTTPAVQTPFLGLAPGLIGVEQINFVVPANQRPGDWALFFNIGSCPDGRGGQCSQVGDSSRFVKLPVR